MRVTTWKWDCDSSGSTDATTENATFTYTVPGAYRAALSVVTPAGSDAATGPPGDIIVSPPVPPAAGFGADPRAGTIPLEVAFTDYSFAGTSPITEWDWDFTGDGNPDSTEQNPVVHVFIGG